MDQFKVNFIDPLMQLKIVLIASAEVFVYVGNHSVTHKTCSFDNAYAYAFYNAYAKKKKKAFNNL